MQQFFARSKHEEFDELDRESTALAKPPLQLINTGQNVGSKNFALAQKVAFGRLP